jgi:beta-glucosidase
MEDDTTNARRFPASFLWGASTSAYQIEGSPKADGRGESIWDRFSHEPGRVAGGANGDVACDGYQRWREDLELLSGLGLNAYRFSIAWPRIVPTGTGRIEPRGLDHYDRVIDALVERGIVPVVTLYHWDLPQPLQDDGGWCSRATAERFAEYAGICFERFGDRVGYWVTQCEPWIVAVLGYELGVHAPGEKDLARSAAAAHHVLLSHGLATQALEASGHEAAIGVAFSLFPNYPASDSADDVAASWASDGYVNRWYLDPVLTGNYPEDQRARYEEHIGDLDFIADGDLEVIGRRCDFIGVNYYTRRRMAVAPGRSPWPWVVEPPLEDVAVSDSGWEIVPECLTDLLLRLHRDYGGRPLLITENGCVVNARPGEDGTVHDDRRISFIHAHLSALHDAMSNGAKVLGYCHWSLMDNFEWALGYDQRFGLVHVDYATQKRTPKKSAAYYGAIARENSLAFSPPQQ